MIRSMTGFARAEHDDGKNKCVVEIRTVNHRFLEINVRTASKNYELIKKIKDIFSASITRGSVEVSVNFTGTEDGAKKVVVDEDMVRQYIDGAKGIAKKFSIPGEIQLSTLLGLKDIFKSEEEEEDMARRWTLIEKSLQTAIGKLVDMRAIEGEALKNDLINRLDEIKTSADNILAARIQNAAEIAEKIRARLLDAFKDMKLDEQRILMEAAIIADRADISEEITRLESHIDQARELLQNGGMAGRKLEFLLQEMNREANTIGSKSNLYNISAEVVEIKSALEKMREQAANVE